MEARIGAIAGRRQGRSKCGSKSGGNPRRQLRWRENTQKRREREKELFTPKGWGGDEQQTKEKVDEKRCQEMLTRRKKGTRTRKLREGQWKRIRSIREWTERHFTRTGEEGGSRTESVWGGT